MAVKLLMPQNSTARTPFSPTSMPSGFAKNYSITSPGTYLRKMFLIFCSRFCASTALKA